MSATPVQTIRRRRAFALGLGAILLVACGDSATDPDIDGDDDQSSSSSSGRASSSSGGSSGRSSSSGGSSGRTGSSSSGSSSGGSSSGESSSGSSSGETSSSGGSSGEAATYTIGGTLAGYAGSGLVITAAGQTLTVPAGATTFAFAQGLPTGAGYEVEVAVHPTQPAQTCTVANAEGIVQNTNVNDVVITCTTAAVTHVVRVATQGLVGNLSLQNNGGDTLVVNGAAGAFATPLATGANYNVTVSAQPPGQVCTVESPSGVIADADVTVDVTCVNQVLEPLEGTVEGLTAGGLILANGADRLTINADDIFEMPTGVPAGGAFNVTVFQQPPGQRCEVFFGQGIMPAGGYDEIEVECEPDAAGPFPVTVTVAGLEADSVVLTAEGERTIAANGTFSFNKAMGANYSVTVKRNPRSPQQVCTVVNGNGVVNAPVDVQVNCVSDCVQLVINEVQLLPQNSQFVEILNKGTCEAAAGVYSFQYRSANNTPGQDTPIAEAIPPGGYFLFAAATPRKAVLQALGQTNGQAGIVRTASPNVAVDGVAWGNVANGLFREGATVTAPATGKSIARVPNGKDTHVNTADFKLQNAPTRNAANPAN